MPPADVRSDSLQGENDMTVIAEPFTSDIIRLGGCVTKYRVRITTDDGSIVVDDNNVMSSSYLLRIMKLQIRQRIVIQVYSITEDAVESAIGSGNTLPIKGSTATFELLWVGIAIEPLLAFVLAFLLGLCIGLKKRVPKEATNRQPPGSGMNPQRAERTEAAARSNQIASAVKQKRPTNVEEAVVATIELESYLGSSGKPLRVSAVSPQEPDPDTVKLLGERLQRLEMLLERQGSSTRPRTTFDSILKQNHRRTRSCNCWTGPKRETVVPAGSEMEAMVKIAGPVTNGTWFVGHKSATCNGVMVANAVVSPSSNVVPVRILNPRDEMVVLKKGTQIASMELLEQDPVINISTVMKNAEVSLECQNILWDLVSKVGSHISESEREQLYSLLVEFANVFSFSSKDLGRTKELKHHIFTSDAQPVHLSPRRIPQARREELRGLLRDMLESDVNPTV
eukprot:Em0229g1a